MASPGRVHSIGAQPRTTLQAGLSSIQPMVELKAATPQQASVMPNDTTAIHARRLFILVSPIAFSITSQSVVFRFEQAVVQPRIASKHSHGDVERQQQHCAAADAGAEYADARQRTGSSGRGALDITEFGADADDDSGCDELA